VHRSFLVFGMAFIAMMAGVLFYAAHLPVQAPPPPAPAEPVAPAGPAAIYPSFTLSDLDGRPRTLDEWAGRPRLLNFWATWCAPCRREIPLLKAFQERQGEDGVQVIGIAVDFPEAVSAYAADAAFNYPIVVGEEDAMAVAESSGIEFVGMPFTMIVAADGELLNAHIGEIVAADLEHIERVLGLLDQGEIDKDSARSALEFL
jgi:thiol-disulfide isomerase/thioredoxin